eukprot:g511.t1
MMLQSIPAFFVFTIVAVLTEMNALLKHLAEAQESGTGWPMILGLVSVSSALALVSNLGRCFLVASTSALMETFAGNTKVAALCVIDNRLFGTKMYGLGFRRDVGRYRLEPRFLKAMLCYNYAGVTLTFMGFSVHVLLQYLSGAKHEAKAAKERNSKAKLSGRQGEGANDELERLKQDEEPQKGGLTKTASSHSGIFNMPRLISGAETGLFSEHLAVNLGRDHPLRRRKGRKPTRQLTQACTAGDEGEVPPLTRGRSRTWHAGEDRDKGWIGDLNPVLEAPDWLNDTTSSNSGCTAATSPDSRSTPSGIPVIDRAVSRNRFNSDLMPSTGTVKSFNPAKGWGFIDCCGVDVFVHVKYCIGGQPAVGDEVTFDIEKNPKCPEQPQANPRCKAVGRVRDGG